MTEKEMKSLEQAALACMEEHKDELYQTLSQLVQINSQNFGETGLEQECAEFVEKLYQDFGLDTELYYPNNVPGVLESPLFWPWHNTDKRPNVTGIKWGADRDSRIMIEAHTDTMPTGDLDKWELSPFSGAIRDGKLYGLGSGDNKFGIAGGYWALKVLDMLGVKLKKSVALTAYCDEEFGGGNGALAACLKYPCDTYVNLDGGNYEMWVTALGGGCFSLDLHLNRTTDDWQPIYDVFAAFAAELKVFGQRRRDELHINPYYTGTDMERSAYRLSKFHCVGESHTDARLGFTIYTDKSKEEIYAELDAIMEKMRPMMEEYGVTTQGFVGTTRFFGYYETDRNHPAVREMKRCAEEAIGHEIRVCGSCLTDLSVILPAGKTNSSFNFGILRDFALPGGAHQPNEYVECEQFLAHTKALILFLIRYCGVAGIEGKK